MRKKLFSRREDTTVCAICGIADCEEGRKDWNGAIGCLASVTTLAEPLIFVFVRQYDKSICQWGKQH